MTLLDTAPLGTQPFYFFVRVYRSIRKSTNTRTFDAVLNSSALGGVSVSNQLGKDALTELRSRDPDQIVSVRDLGTNPIPHLNTDSATVLRGAAPVNEAQAIAQELSDTLIAELKEADTIVIGAPMYNFGIPSTLKAWFDYVLRAGITFRYTEAGPVGLLEGKRAIVIESRGGYYSDGATKALDTQEPHLRTLLGFMGIKDATFIRVEKLAFGPEARQQALDGARAQLEQLLTENQYMRAA